MPLAPGTSLGPYQIDAPLGVGGMGEVYRGTDTRLDRTVAIKVLPEHVAADPDTKQRFEREAKTISSLNHPHICTLYDIGNQDGIDYLVMEYLDGETLAQRLEKGALPLDHALQIAIEIADALDKAHRQGIVHRDLKPGNIMLTQAGAKLLDFGLAKLRNSGWEVTRFLDDRIDEREDRDEIGATASAEGPTKHLSLTAKGTILGTFQYMSPEQIEGHAVDPGSDIFSFGAVLYEMVTGRKAFEGSSRATLIGAILLQEPRPILDESRVFPPLLDRLIRRCLAKDREERWQSARDVLAQLRWIGDDASLVTAGSESHTWPALVWGSVAGCLVGILVGGLSWGPGGFEPVSRGVAIRLDVAVPEGETLSVESFPTLALSPGGTRLVFRAERDGVARLFLRELGDFEVRPLPGTEDAHTPFFSPDSEWIGFVSNSVIWRTAVEDGLPVAVAEAPSLSPSSPGATWSPGGMLVFAAGTAGLMQVSVLGGTPTVLTTPDPARGEETHFSPQFLPGGDDVLFSVLTSDGTSRLAILSIATRDWWWLDPVGEVSGARYAATGHIVFAQGGGLYAISFDVGQRTFGGTPTPLADDVFAQVVGGTTIPQFGVSDSGTVAYVSGVPPERRLVSVTRGSGEPRRLSDIPHSYRYPKVSPDGRHIAVTVDEDRSDIYIIDTERGSVRPMTRLGANIAPFWLDAENIAFASRRERSSGWDIYLMPVDGRRPPEPLLVRDEADFPTGLSPDGSTMLLYTLGNETARDIWVRRLDDGATVPLLATPANERAATFSHDGQLIAYVSGDDGDDQVWVQRYPDGGREIASTNGGREPVWSPLENELFFREGNRLMTVTIESVSPLRIGPPAVILEGPYLQASAEVGRPNYDVFPDGRRFVLVRSEQRGQAPHLHVIQDWVQQDRTQVAREN